LLIEVIAIRLALLMDAAFTGGIARADCS